MVLGVSDSLFCMWRTLFALVHADGVVADGEVRFMAEAMEDIPFSADQASVLREDMLEPQDIEGMFAGVSDLKDQAVFFKYAHALVHSDGDYGEDEQEIMLRLKTLHTQVADVGDLVGVIDLEFDHPSLEDESLDQNGGRERVKKTFFSLRRWSLQE